MLYLSVNILCLKFPCQWRILSLFLWVLWLSRAYWWVNHFFFGGNDIIHTKRDVWRSTHDDDAHLLTDVTAGGKKVIPVCGFKASLESCDAVVGPLQDVYVFFFSHLLCPPYDLDVGLCQQDGVVGSKTKGGKSNWSTCIWKESVALIKNLPEMGGASDILQSAALSSGLSQNIWMSTAPRSILFLKQARSGAFSQIKLQPLGFTYIAALYLILLSDHNDSFKI